MLEYEGKEWSEKKKQMVKIYKKRKKKCKKET